MSSLPTFDSVNNTKIFNGTSQYMQIAPTNINLANGFAITTTFTPTAATPPTSGETLCSFFQGTGASNAITIARSNVTSQFNLNFINSIGSNQGINIGNLVSGNTYQLAIQSYLNNTNFNINATSLTANQSLTTYYTGSSLITSITAYATSLIANYTSSGYLTTTPLSIYLYNGSTWTLVAYITCLASSSVTLISSISPNQTSVYKLALSVIGDGATYLSYNTNQSTNTLFNTPAIPTIGTITPAAQQFTIGAATYSAGYLSTTVATYTLAVSPFTTFTNSIASTLGASSTTVGANSLTANTQYKIKLVIADPVNTSVLSSLIYTLATVSFVATPITNLTSTSFTVTWNSAGSPATYYSVNLTVALTSTPFTTVYTQNGITDVSGTTSMSINPPLVANTGYTVSLVPVNTTGATNTAVTTTTTTYAIVTSASAAVTSYASATITWAATSGATVSIISSPLATPATPQAFSSSPALFVGLSQNTSYTFTVTAVNASGTNPSAGDKKTTGSITTYTQGSISSISTGTITSGGTTVYWTNNGYPSGTQIQITISNSLGPSVQVSSITPGTQQSQSITFTSGGSCTINFAFVNSSDITKYGTLSASSGSITVPQAIALSGGTSTTNGSWYLQTFTSSGTLTVSAQTTVDFLLVGGGGSGGTEFDGQTPGGGGGAGQVIVVRSYSLASGSYAVNIGPGGTVVQGSGTSGSNPGTNSTFNGFTALGGGYGGGSGGQGGIGGAGGNGGSGGGSGTGNGGGASSGGSASTTTEPASTIYVAGYPGAGKVATNSYYNYCGAGGGAGSMGGYGGTNNLTNSGNGITSLGGINFNTDLGISASTSGFIAAGGAANSGTQLSGSGVIGGTAALANTGSGGYGGVGQTFSSAGGSGIFVIRYGGSQPAAKLPYLINGSFESQTLLVNYGTYLSYYGWSIIGWSSSGSVGLSYGSTTNSGYQGAATWANGTAQDQYQCVFIQANTSSGLGYIYQTVPYWTIGYAYTISVWIKLRPATNTNYGTFNIAIDSSTSNIKTVTTNASYTSWTQVTTSFTATATSHTLYLTTIGSSTADYTLLMDNVTISI